MHTYVTRLRDLPTIVAGLTIVAYHALRDALAAIGAWATELDAEALDRPTPEGEAPHVHICTDGLAAEGHCGACDEARDRLNAIADQHVEPVTVELLPALTAPGGDA